MDNSMYRQYPFTVYTYDSVDSTNAIAKRAVSSMGSSLDMSVHVAGEQTDGKGRRNRHWLNTDEAVMMSIVQSTKLGANKIPILNLVAAAAVRNALLNLTGYGIDISIKWPNDIVTSERMEKICGILSEVLTISNTKYAIIGIGVNLNASEMPSDLLQPATSVFRECGRHIPVLDAVNEILNEYETQYDLMMSDTEAFLKRFSESCVSLGRHVSVINGDEKLYGIGESLAPNGQLVVKFEDGRTDVVYAADVSIRNQDVIDDRLAKKLLPKRSSKANKGDCGHAAIIAGSDDMPGAALMCTKACIRSGAGLTRVLIPNTLVPSFGVIPEAMLVSNDEGADKLIDWADAILIGCGMGVGDRTAGLLEKVLRSGKKCVIDADAINTLAVHRELLELLHDKAVITPHPAEMARLCEMKTAEVLKRFTPSAMGFAEKYGCNVLLKSSSSVIAAADGRLRYNDSGNNGLAKGGSGDVLAGIVVSMAAQGADPFDAAAIGSYLLGVSSEKALGFLHNRFIEATDIVDIISAELF